MDTLDADVIVVGAGPTGLILAGELRLAGVATIVVERLAAPMGQSRGLGFTARAMEVFDQRGLLPRFGELETSPMGHFGGLPLDYSLLEGGHFGARGVPQSITESVLNDWAAELGTDIRRSHEVVGLADDGDRVHVEVATPDGPGRLGARWLVGCDGGRSVVRRLAGFDFPGTDATREMYLADVVGQDLRPRFTGERVPGGMVMAAPLGDGVDRIIVCELGTPPRNRPDGLSYEELADAWERLTGEDIHAGSALWVSAFSDTARQASEYRRGRVLLAGDAAHVHLPAGGQGLSVGVQDAANLGWKLAAEIHGHAPPGLLDTYHSERHPVGARVLTNTQAQGSLYLTGDDMQPLREVFAELMVDDDVKRRLAGMVSGLDIRYDVGPGDHPLLGYRLPNQDLVVGDEKTTNYELLHAGHGVLLDLVDDPELREAAAPWVGRVDTVAARQHDCESPLDALLVRPDGYVAWLAPDGPDAGSLTDALTRWFGPGEGA